MLRFDLSPADLSTYRPAVAEPADFDDFWTGTIGAARAAGGEVSETTLVAGVRLWF